MDRWGRRSLGLLEITLRDRWRLTEGHATVELPTVDCYPRPAAQRTRVVLSRLPSRLGEHPSRSPGEGLEFTGVREFVPGDRQRRVNWPATTRRGRLQLNTFAAERTQNVVIVADASSEVGEPGSTPADLALRGSAAAARAYLAVRDRVGFVIYQRSVRWLAPGFGARHYYRIMDLMLADPGLADMRSREAGITRLPRAGLPPGSLILVFSPLLDRQAGRDAQGPEGAGLLRPDHRRAERRAVGPQGQPQRARPPDLADGAAGDQVLAARARHPARALGRRAEPGRAAGPVHPEGHGEPPVRFGPRDRATGAAGLLAAACVVWSASPLSGTGHVGPVLLAAAAACAAASVAQLALGPDPGDSLVYLNPVLRAVRMLADLVRRWPWAEGLVIAALVLEALHRSRPWHTGLLGAALLAYLLAVHLAESRARLAVLRPQAPLLAAGLGLLALAAGAAMLPAATGSAADLMAVLAALAAIAVGAPGPAAGMTGPQRATAPTA